MNIRLLLAAALTTPLVCLGASFDCSKANTDVEVLVCSDGGLSRLDESLAEAYRAAQARSSDRASITRWQRDWLKSYQLAVCKDSACLSKEYSSRIHLLEQVALDPADARWTGAYVRFFDGKVDPSAQLTIVRLVNNRIFISGSAYWKGPNLGQIHTGEVEGIGTISSNQASFDLAGCKGLLALSAGRLVVKSESGCGGLNVSFVGEYKAR